MKVGDRVIVNGEYRGLEFDSMAGTILAVVCDNVCVEFDGYINGNSYFEGKPGHCWYVRKSMVKKEEIKEESKWGFMMDYCYNNNLCAAKPECWMEAGVAYYNTKNKKENVMEERIEELEKELATLKAQLTTKYEPKPANYCILGDGYIEYLDDWGNYAKNGRAFDTKEKAEKARDIMVKHDIILKYVIDHAPDYAPDWNNFAEKKWAINYCVESKKWGIEFWEAYNSFGMIVMPKWVAKKLADDLNNNRIDEI